ncbi:hypothetical protein UFOVP29_275 [uncultured Caudovirales phage]|uniref:Baseplate hub assembly protein, bacteriophage T4-like n=1 Tax=uncultured Caudovirales phage TaxID=2100421 RepID=A0A6J5KPC0_9CAUD|nr:hypothetical protein UFOVP29_275 [uncultured Caudovirales phage]
MTSNPLQSYFRQATTYILLPSQGKWYQPQDVTLTASNEISIMAMTARDDVLLNTPDAMLNGEALKKVIQNCVPDVHNVNALLMPDLEAIFVGMKLASNNGSIEINKVCPSCGAECNFDLQCQSVLDGQVMIDLDDSVVYIDQTLRVHVKPYNFQQRSIFIQREFEEEKILRSFDASNPNPNEFTRAEVMAEAVDRISLLTYRLVAGSITSVEILSTGEHVSDPNNIAEWLMNITSQQAEKVMQAVDDLNKCGPQKQLPIQCAACQFEWKDGVNYDPISFFAKRS